MSFFDSSFSLVVFSISIFDRNLIFDRDVTSIDVFKTFRHFNVLRDFHRRFQSTTTFNFSSLFDITGNQRQRRNRNFFVDQKRLTDSSISVTKLNTIYSTFEKSFVSGFRFNQSQSQSYISSSSHINQTENISRNIIIISFSFNVDQIFWNNIITVTTTFVVVPRFIAKNSSIDDNQ